MLLAFSALFAVNWEQVLWRQQGQIDPDIERWRFRNIVDACRRVVSDWANGEPVEIDENTLGRYMYTSEQPDPDLLVRTSGELRISNFLLWQIAYSEIWVTETLWPDFRRQHLWQAIVEFQARERRFGAVQDEQEQATSGKGSRI